MNAITVFYYSIAPICFFLGTFGNTLGYVVMLRKKMTKIGAKHIYRYLFITDTVFMLQMVADIIAYHYGYDITKLSVYSCKAYYYFSYTLASLSPMLLVYLAIERYVSIRYPAKRLVLRRGRSQFYYLLLVVVFNTVFYLPFIFSFNLRHTSADSVECDFFDSKHEFILSVMDLVSRVLVPCILITMSTCLLLHCIFRSRHRVLKSFSIAENRTLKKDIKLAVTSICLNIIYVFLIVPLPMFLVMSGGGSSDFSFHFFFFLFYLSFCVNFYVIFVSNSLFRDQFLDMFRKKTLSPLNKPVNL